MASTRTKMLTSSLAAVALLLGCADVPSTGPTPPDLRAEFRFVNAAPELGNVQVSVDGVARGSIDFAGNLNHQSYPAGSRSVALSNGETQFVAMPTNARGTVVLLPAAAGAPREFFNLAERRIFDAPRTALRVLNFNTTYAVVVRVKAGADTVSTTNLAYKGDSGYQNLAAGTYDIEVKNAADGAVLTTTSVNVTTSHTTMILGNAAVAVSNLSDN